MPSWVIPWWVGSMPTPFDRRRRSVLLLLALAAPLCRGQQPLPTPAAEVASERNELAKASGPHDTEGKRHGKWRLPREGGLRSESGAPTWIGHEEGLFVHGKREGEWVQFDKDGRRQGMRSYKDDVVDGRWWLDTGGMELEGFYRAGVSEGPSKSVTHMKNGSLETRSGNFLAGKKHGTWTNVNSRGSHSEEVFEHGTKIGATYWHENGALSATYSYRRGKAHGTARQWHPNGQLEREQEYVDGQRHGASTFWHDNGQKFIETKFAADKEVGSYCEWSRDGKLVVHWVTVGRDRKYLVSRDTSVVDPKPRK